MIVLSDTFDTDVSIQTAIGLLLISLSIALIIIGILIIKFKILDTGRLFPSNIIGAIMVVGGIALLLASILGIIHVNYFME